LAGVCGLGAGLAWSAAALAGGDPSAVDTGGVALPRAGEAPVQIIQGQPARATGQPKAPGAPAGEVVYVITGEGTQVYSLKDYLAAAGTEPSPALPVAPQSQPPRAAVVAPAAPAVAAPAPMPVSPPRTVAREQTAPPAQAPAQTAVAQGAAEPGRGGFFLGVRAIGSVAQTDVASTTGFAGAPTVENDSDEVAGLAVIAGYAFDQVPLRAELEVAHRFRFDLDVRDAAMAPIIDYEMNVATTSAIASMILEWRNETAFTPFVGASLGWARNSTETQRTNLGTSVQTSQDNDEDNLAWGGLVGVDWAFAEGWVAELAYRYVNLGDIDTGVVGPGGRITAEDYVSHDVLLSTALRF
jgi:opacity protein-like surface antigen